MLAPEVVAQAGRGPLGVAVSGGGDSVALLLLLKDAYPEREILVATVDHGLRADSPKEAAWVALLCRSIGVRHQILHWDRCDMQGNLMAAAREARLDLLSRWIIQEGGRTIFLGHTRDDIVETFLMRSRRGAGAHGLAAMKPVRLMNGVKWLRPLLGQSRAALREMLHARQQDWIDDPTNDDQRFERARIRAAINQLQTGLIDMSAAARSAERLRGHAEILDSTLMQLAKDLTSTTRFGEVILAAQPFRAERQSTAKEQLMRAILRYYAGDDVVVRFSEIQEMVRKVEQGEAMTLRGVAGRPSGTTYVFRRERVACRPSRFGTAWDNRWYVGGSQDGVSLRALDVDGLRECGKRPHGLRADVARTFPSIWYEDQLLATPFLKPSEQFRFRLRHFAPTIRAH